MVLKGAPDAVVLLFLLDFCAAVLGSLGLLCDGVSVNMVVLLGNGWCDVVRGTRVFSKIMIIVEFRARGSDGSDLRGVRMVGTLGIT